MRLGAPPPDHPHRSLWLEQALQGEAQLPPLARDDRFDVAIIGGGYVGLWTALRIKQHQPDCSVAVLEMDVCGAGASGRNGGQVHSWWERFASLIDICGVEEAMRMCRATEAALDELEQLQDGGLVDFGFRRDGWLWTATHPEQIGAWNPLLSLLEHHRVSVYHELSEAELHRRTGSAVHLAGIVEDGGGTVHPGRLVRALRGIVLRHGVTIFEGTRVERLERSRPLRLHTHGGVATAECVVLATNAWMASLPEFRRRLFVVSSEIVATTPIRARLDELGWTGGEAISDSQQRVLYYQASADGRVMFGRGGGHVAFGGRVSAAFDRQPRWAADAATAFRRVYPMLADVRIDTDWSGAVDRSITGLPMFGHLGGREDIVYGVGWSGQGVAPSLVGGRILASLALRLRDEWSGCGLVDQRVGERFPREPVLTVGARVVRGAVIRRARAVEAGRSPGRITTAVSRRVPGQKR